MSKQNWTRAIVGLKTSPGSQAAFERFVALTQAELVRLAQWQGLEVEDAEEVVQDVYLRLAAALIAGEVEELDALPGFVKLSVKRAAWRKAAQARREHGRACVRLDDRPEGKPAWEPSSSDSVEAEVETRLDLHRLLARLEQQGSQGLPALLLRARGLSYQEISSRLGLNLNTVKTHLRRTRALVAQSLGLPGARFEDNRPGRDGRETRPDLDVSSRM